MPWFAIIFFASVAYINFKVGKRKLGIISILFVLVGVSMLISTKNPSKKASMSYPGYKSPSKALDFAEKHDQFAIAVGSADIYTGYGPTNGIVIFIMKNTKTKGYTFKHNGKYYYVLKRITKVNSGSNDYEYQYDAIPIHYAKESVTSKYINVSNAYTQGHAKEGLGHTQNEIPN